ncbi:MAG: ROK family protein [Anaerolineales bacterium]|jgi:glucokinase|nr:ROK family protein [Anaerolineales bacterium]MCC6985180.1 ROK family protein [Anaerolineales bacterium]
MSIIVAVDIGGTQMRAAAYTQDQVSPLQQKKIPTLASKPGGLERLFKVIEDVLPNDREISAIGIGSPGPLDPHTGYLLAPPNNPEWHNFPLAPRVQEHFGVRTFLDNDANLAGLAEYRFGAGQGHRNVLYITVSTGIGAGVVIEDRLLQGFHGLAAELGHSIIDPDGPPCSCGFNGHLESFSSGPAIVKYALAELEAGTKSILKPDDSLNARDIADAALKGDELAIRAYQRAGEYLGIGVASFLHAFDPSVVIFGGGVSQVGRLLFDPFEASLRRRVFHPRYLEGLVITQAQLGDNAGLLGARALAEMKSGFR